MVTNLVGERVSNQGKYSIFFSEVDQKCLVAWLEECDNHYKIHTIENHHHRIPIPVLLQAEQKIFGDIGFLRRYEKPPADPLTDVVCRVSTGDITVTLTGYLHPGVSWWRSETNVRRLLGFIQKHNLDGTESLILTGQMWHGKGKRYVAWNERLPLSFPRALYQAGNQPGIEPDFASIASQVLQRSG
jgi:hypothetical protein